MSQDRERRSREKGSAGQRPDQDTSSRRAFLKRTAAGLVSGTVALPLLATTPESHRERLFNPKWAAFSSDWPAAVERVWIGPEYWSNPLQDWRISNGRLELVNVGAGRNVHLLTRTMGANRNAFEMRVLTGAARPGSGRSGFELGIAGPLEDYRSSAVHGRGWKAGVTLDGELFIENGETQHVERIGEGSGILLHLSARADYGAYRIVLTARDPQTNREIGHVDQTDVEAKSLEGNVALFADFDDADGHGLGWGEPRVWFEDWRMTGDAFQAHDDRTFGPILFAQHTLSRGVLKMTAQMAPVEKRSDLVVKLQVDRGAGWETAGVERIHPLARVATFRLEGWDAAANIPYRLVYPHTTRSGIEHHHYAGTIRREPVDKETLIVGGFSCVTDAGFPHVHVAEGAAFHDPDVLAFTGDQLYEQSGGFGVQRHRQNVELSTLDYLRKWFLHGWAFGDLMRDRPTICITDDHDVYQGNIWGENGEPVHTYQQHDSGGYFMPAEWVNMVQQTQTSHLPDPYDPRPVDQGITVYYTDMLYGRVSFAVLEDRKWKSGPDGVVPPHESTRADHIKNPDVDPQSLDVPAAVLLGERQHLFLDDWTADWRGADFKVIVSQSALASVATHHGAEMEYLVADLDSNGWPRTPRNEALRRFRKGFAFHLGGDQHLPLVLRYGVDDWDDAVYSFCVPAVATGYPRWFLPNEAPPGRRHALHANTGRYTDGLANKVTVCAVANPTRRFRSEILERQEDKKSGYGIVRLNKKTGEITMESWPIRSDPRRGDSEQHAGWPRIINKLDNYARKPAAYLPSLIIEGMASPIVQIIEEQTEDIVYTLRLTGPSFRPPVFSSGLFTIKIGDDADWLRSIQHVRSTPSEGSEPLRIRIR